MADPATALVPFTADAVTVPGHSSTGDPNASVTAVPMDDVVTSQPVTAYFQFIQNNVHQIQAGNVEGVMREAEQRHREIMAATLENVRQQYDAEVRRQQSAMNEQLAEAQRQVDQMRVQHSANESQNMQIHALQAQVQSLKEQIQTLEQNNEVLQRHVQSGSESVTGLQNTIRELRIENQQAVERTRNNVAEGFKVELSREIQRAADDTLNQAGVTIAELKADYENELQEQKRKLQAEIVAAKSDIEMCADSNERLQEELDEAYDEIRKLKAAGEKPQETERPVVPAGTAAPSQPARKSQEPAPPQEPASSPKANVAPKESMAEQVARRLKDMKGESKATKTGEPALPIDLGNLPKVPSTVSVAQTTPIRTSVYASPAPSVVGDAAVVPEKPNKGVAAEAGLSSEHLLELVKALTKREDSDGKPKIKEAETIKLHDMPTPETYRSWKNHVRDEVKACSDKPDEAWEWLNEVYDKRLDRKELEARLQNPGKFITLDTKLSSALTRAAKGDLGTRILNYKDEMSKNNIQVRGRTVLLMFDDYYKTSIGAGSLYRVEDLLGVQKVGDSIGDLRKFLNKWDATIAGMEHPPDDYVLRDILLRQIRGSALLKYDIEVFDRARESSHEKSYKFLRESMKELIDRERLRENRNRIVQRQTGKEGKQPNAGLPAKPDPRKGSPKRERGRSEQPKKKGICYKFQEGKCNLGKSCQYRHESPKRSRSEKGKGKGRERSRSPSKGKPKKMSPCTYFAKGSCKRGDKCYYKRDSNAAPAKGKGKEQSPSELACAKERCQEGSRLCATRLHCEESAGFAPEPFWQKTFSAEKSSFQFQATGH